jgi:hypothetical protein
MRPDKTPRRRFQSANSRSQRTIDDIGGAVRIAPHLAGLLKGIEPFFPATDIIIRG